MAQKTGYSAQLPALVPGESVRDAGVRRERVRQVEARVEARFHAHMFGGPAPRGLRGGAETLTRARSTYLSTEWSGADDRRPEKGLLIRKAI
ncbi:MAG: hypothetical protein AB1429_09550 [Pseudomonadota bacterium]|jgi:hypothetical protein